MRRSAPPARMVIALVAVAVAAVVGLGMLMLSTWLAWPDGGTSTYSTAANVAQLALVLAGVASTGLAVRDLVSVPRPGRSLLFSVLALTTWAVWWILFAELGIGDSAVA